MLKWARRQKDPGREAGETAAEPRSFHLAEGERVYAIGDVHGRFDLLFGLLGKIKGQEAGRPPANTTIVMLGDLIDRGPDSAAVVQFLMRWERAWARIVALKGNHEEKLVRLLEGESVHWGDWLAVGGAETLHSYGVSDELIRTAQTGVLTEAARSEIPMAHQRWLRSLASHWQCGDYLFVHAGVKPGVPIPEQKERDLFTIRSEFLDSDADHGLMVVHGHSVEPLVDHRANRIGIDTGAWHTGKLTAIGIEGAETWFITQVGLPGDARNHIGSGGNAGGASFAK